MKNLYTSIRIQAILSFQTFVSVAAIQSFKNSESSRHARFGGYAWTSRACAGRIAPVPLSTYISQEILERERKTGIGYLVLPRVKSYLTAAFPLREDPVGVVVPAKRRGEARGASPTKFRESPRSLRLTTVTSRRGMANAAPEVPPSGAKTAGDWSADRKSVV